MVQKFLDPCAGASWPPKVTGILNLTSQRATSLQRSPGPAYKLPGLVGYIGHDPRSVHRLGPAYTIKGRHARREFDHSPGPIYLPFIKPFGNGISIKSRTKERLTNDGPGPAAYMVVPMKSCNLGISLRQRFKDNFLSNSPGPAAYNLPSMIGCHKPPTKQAAPCYSIIGKPKVLGRTSGPGPGAYTIVTDCCYKPCPPKYSISPRIYPPEAGCVTPGPGAYCPEKVRYFKEPPHYSFGIRWSENANRENLDKEPLEVEDKCPVTC